MLESHGEDRANIFVDGIAKHGLILDNHLWEFTFARGTARGTLGLSFSRDPPIHDWHTDLTPDSDHHKIHISLPLDGPILRKQSGRTVFRWRHTGLKQLIPCVTKPLLPSNFVSAHSARPFASSLPWTQPSSAAPGAEVRPDLIPGRLIPENLTRKQPEEKKGTWQCLVMKTTPPINKRGYAHQTAIRQYLNSR